MKNDTIEGYDAGYGIGLDAIENCQLFPDQKPSDIFAGLLTAIIGAGYFIAPTEEQMDTIIDFARDTSKQNIKEGLKK